MVTAILPSLTDETGSGAGNTRKRSSPRGRPSVALSVDSEVTITPERFRNSASTSPLRGDEPAGSSGSTGKPSALAGYVGLFTGCGALVALSFFLPLPARFGRIQGVTLAQAVEYSYYVVGAVSFAVAVFVFIGLRGLKGEEGKGWRMLLGLESPTAPFGSSSTLPKTVSALFFPFPKPTTLPNPPSPLQKPLPYLHLLRHAVSLSLTDSCIALGYLGGFVARASTVAISLFLPLAVNTFFIRNGFCQGSPHDPSPDLKRECRQAYVLAAVLTGVAQLVGLLCAPLFGYLSARQGPVNWPVVVAALLGVVGYAAFPWLPSPEFRDVDGRGGGPVVFFLAALMGVSQIGAIVCSLGSLGRGVLRVEEEERDGDRVVASRRRQRRRLDGDQETLVEGTETAPLLRPESPILPDEENEDDDDVDAEVVSRVQLKGSVAGVYSWCGGAAILLLTKVGGYLFDSWSTGAPFYMMAGFNGVLLLASIAIDVGRAAARRQQGI